MKKGKTEADTCRKNGWTVGTILEGDEGYGPTRIIITAIGEESILARCIDRNGEPQTNREATWTLTCREWHRVNVLRCGNCDWFQEDNSCTSRCSCFFGVPHLTPEKPGCSEWLKKK